MPTKVANRRSGTSFAPEDIALRASFQADYKSAMERLLRIEDREVEGKLVAFRFNDSQLQLHELWEDIRAFNVVRSALRDPSGLPAVEELLGFKLQGRLRPLIAKVREKNVHYLLLRARAVGVKLTDGPVSIIILKPRQIGVSTYVQGRFFLNAMLTDNFSVDIIAHKDKPAQNIFRKSKIFYDAWPTDLLRLRELAETNARDEMSWTHGSRLVVETAGGREGSRSFTFRAVHASEFAHFKDYNAIGALKGTMPEGATYIEESTANGRAGQFYDDWESARTLDEVIRAYEEGDAEFLDKWNELFKFFVPWFDDADHQTALDPGEAEHLTATLDANERSLLRRFPDRITLEKLKWRRRKIKKDCTGVPGVSAVDFFRQEFPADEHEAFIGAGTLVFDQDVLAEMERRNKHVQPVSLIVLLNDWTPMRADGGNANLHIYDKPRPGRFYCAGIDVAQGLATGDFSVLVMFDRTDGTFYKEVAMWRSRLITPRAVGDISCVLGEYYNQAYLTPEANNQGATTCERIVENRYPLIYQRTAWDTMKTSQRDTGSWRFGYYTSGNGAGSKVHLIGLFQLALQQGQVDLLSPLGIAEFKAMMLVDGKYQAPRSGGSAAHGSGHHDDFVSAATLGFFGGWKKAPPVVVSLKRSLEQKGDLSPDEISFLLAVQKKLKRSERGNRAALGRDWRPRDTAKAPVLR